MFLAVLLLALAPVPRPPDEFLERCAALSSPAAGERAAAERWLAAHLEPGRHAELMALARGADAEVRARLERIVAADPRRIGLALALAVEGDAGLATLGRSALRLLVSGLEQRLGEPARRGGELISTLERVASSGWPRLLRVDLRRPLGEILLELESSGALEVGLTLDPGLETRVPRMVEGLAEGPWEEVLDQLMRAFGLSLEGHGLPVGREADARTSGFLRLFEKGLPSAGAELVTDWLLLVAGTGPEGVRLQAARNLAAIDLGPVLDWLAARARAGDRAALEGVLLAGARGRLAAPLLEPEFVAGLLDEAERGGPFSVLVLAALEQVPRSGEIVALLRARLTGSRAARWLALTWFARTGTLDSAVLEHARATLADPASAPALRLAALQAWASQAPAGSPPPAVAEPLALFALPVDEAERERLGRTLAGLGLAPPARDPRQLAPTVGLGERLALLEAWAWNGEVAALGAHLAAWATGSESEVDGLLAALSRALQPWRARGRGPLFVQALAEARKRVPAASRALDRLELLLGLVPPAEVAAALKRGAWLLTGPSADLALVGALAGYPSPFDPGLEASARETLHGALAAALQGDGSRLSNEILLDALARAATGLFAAGRDEEGEAFAKRVRTAVRRGPKGALRRQVEMRLWPPAPLAPVRDLAREFAARGLPAGL